MNDQDILQSINNKLSALVALAALSLSGEGREVKLEILLKNVGLEVLDIARVLGKQEGAVRKTIQRAK